MSTSVECVLEAPTVATGDPLFPPVDFVQERSTEAVVELCHDLTSIDHLHGGVTAAHNMGIASERFVAFIAELPSLSTSFEHAFEAPRAFPGDPSTTPVDSVQERSMEAAAELRYQLTSALLLIGPTSSVEGVDALFAIVPCVRGVGVSECMPLELSRGSHLYAMQCNALFLKSTLGKGKMVENVALWKWLRLVIKWPKIIKTPPSENGQNGRK